VGHAGWAGGQLEDELRTGSWLTMEATAQLVFSDQPDLWSEVKRQVGEALLKSMIGVKHIPDDPSCN
jgi:putative AlgH/UPF0301 family transcriptional regulator